MNSIPHASKVNTFLRSDTSASLGKTGMESGELRGFYYDPRRAVIGPNYLLLRWLPREGPLFVAFIGRLRLHCYANPKTGEVRNQCFPSLATLAQECGVGRRTICRLLARDQQGHFVNRSLERFLKVIPRRRYDAQLEREVQTSNLYLVAMDDPPVPEDDHLVAEKEAELAALLALSQTPEGEACVARDDKVSEEGSECQNDTLNAVPKWHPQSCAILAHESITFNNQRGRFPTPGSHPPPMFCGWETPSLRHTRSSQDTPPLGSFCQAGPSAEGPA